MLALVNAKQQFLKQGIKKRHQQLPASESNQLHFRTDHLRSMPKLASNLYSSSNAELGEIKSLSIHIASDEDKLKNSVCFIDDLKTFDKTEPHNNGLYDLRMGPSDLKHTCKTCLQNIHNCPKHNSSILFLRCKYNVCHLKSIFMTLNIVCHECRQVRIGPQHPKYRKVMKIQNPMERLTTLYQYCRMVNYCGGNNRNGNRTCKMSNPLEFLNYLKKRKADPKSTPYRGCGALQRVYVINKKEPLIIRCFDRLPVIKRRRKSAMDQEDNEEEGEEEELNGDVAMNEDEDSAQELEGEENNEHEEEEPENPDENEHDDDKEGNLEGDECDDANDDKDELNEIHQDMEENEEMNDIDEVDEVETDEIETDQETETKSLPDPEFIDSDALEMQALLESVDRQIENEEVDINLALGSTSQITAPPMDVIMDLQPWMNTPCISIQFREFDAWINSNMQLNAFNQKSRHDYIDQNLSDPKDLKNCNPDKQMYIPFCSLSTSRMRLIPEKLKQRLPPFDPQSEYMFSANDTYEIFQHISKFDHYILGFGGESSPSALCSRVMAIVPAAVQMRAGTASSDMQNQHGDSDIIKNLKRILTHNREVNLAHEQLIKLFQKGASLKEIRELHKKLLSHEEQLHLLVAAYVHRDASGIAFNALGRNKVPSKSIIENFLTKYGIVRNGMNSKRCNWTSRTTISPAYGIDIDEVELPEYICIKSTRNEQVNRYNIHLLQQLVNNGPFVYPGAKRIYTKDGKTVELQFSKSESRVLNIGDTVERHQLEQEICIMNRQPTLHRPSMMAHRIVVYPGLSARIPTPVTTPYNADFDGDEMTEHFLQNPQSTIEGQQLMSVHKQMVNSQGRCLVGCKYNGIIGSFLLSDSRNMHGKQIVFDTLLNLRYFKTISDPSLKFSELPPPSTWKFINGKFKPFWTGKQLLSMCFPKQLFYRYGECTNEMLWKNQYICIFQGELLSGQLTGEHVATGKHVIWQRIWTQLGSRLAIESLSDHTRLTNLHVYSYGFSAKIIDLMLPESNRNEMQNVLDQELYTHVESLKKKIYETGNENFKQTKTNKLHDSNGSNNLYKQATTRDSLTCHESDSEGNMFNQLQFLKKQLFMYVYSHYEEKKNNAHPHQSNAFADLVISDTKGKTEHLCQMRALIGQIQVQGTRNKPVFGSRPFPHFAAHSLDPQTYGFITHSYVTGQTTMEAFVNSQKGNEDNCQSTTVIAGVGYLQRRLTKALEDEMLSYDGSLRSLKQISSFIYGEDGFDSAYLNSQSLPWINWSLDKLNKYFKDDVIGAFESKFCSNSRRTRHHSRASMDLDHSNNSYESGNSFSLTISLHSLLALEMERILLWLDRLRQFRLTFDLIGKELVHETLRSDIKLPVIFIDLFVISQQTFNLSGSICENLKRNSFPHHNFISTTLHWIQRLNKIKFSTDPITTQTEILLQEIYQKKLEDLVSPQACFIFVYCLSEACRRVFVLSTPRVKLNIALYTFLSVRQVCMNYKLTWSQLLWIGYKILTSVIVALMHPGEMTGISAAQSASEPTAQMTLNTFHIGSNKDKEENSTLSRLEEIARKAPEISQSIIRVPILPHLKDHQKSHELMEKYLTHRVVLYFINRIKVLELSEILPNVESDNHTNPNLNKRKNADKLDKSYKSGSPNNSNRSFPSLSEFVKDLFDVWHQDESKFTKPTYNWSSRSKQPHPMEIYSTHVLDFELHKSKLLDHGMTIYDVVSAMIKRFKHSANLHQWIVSPMVDKNWKIQLRLCCKSKEYLTYWKKSPSKSIVFQENQQENQKLDDGRDNGNISSSREVLRNLFLLNEQEQHEFVLRHFQASILALTIIGDSKISDLSIEDFFYWKYQKANDTGISINNNNTNHLNNDPNKKSLYLLERVTCKVLYMKGTNLSKLMQMPGIDLSRLYSNNICKIEELMDVHAGLLLTLREIRKIYQSNGQYVDDAVLRQIVFFMGRKGEICAYNRTGFNENPELGPLKKMSFEQILQNIVNAAQSGEVDKLETEISNIMIGKIPPIGTRLCSAKSQVNGETVPSEIISILPQLQQWNEHQLNRRLMANMSNVDPRRTFLKSQESSQVVLQSDYSFIAYDSIDSIDSNVNSSKHKDSNNNDIGKNDLNRTSNPSNKLKRGFIDKDQIKDQEILQNKNKSILKNDSGIMIYLNKLSENLVVLLPNNLKFAPKPYIISNKNPFAKKIDLRTLFAKRTKVES